MIALNVANQTPVTRSSDFQQTEAAGLSQRQSASVSQTSVMTQRPVDSTPQGIQVSLRSTEQSPSEGEPKQINPDPQQRDQARQAVVGVSQQQFYKDLAAQYATQMSGSEPSNSSNVSATEMVRTAYDYQETLSILDRVQQRQVDQAQDELGESLQPSTPVASVPEYAQSPQLDIQSATLQPQQHRGVGVYQSVASMA